MVFGIEVNEIFFFWKKLFSIECCEAWRSLTDGGGGVGLALLGTGCFAGETELSLALTEKY